MTAATTTPIEAVMFDAAGVLTSAFSAELVGPALEAGADADVLMNVLYPIFAHAGDGQSVGNRLERGEVTLEEFFASLPADEAPHVRAVVDPASPTFFGSRWDANDVMQAFVAEVGAAGYRTALVSNIVHEWVPTWERVIPLDLPFDTRIYSCVLGSRKPEPEIYLHAAEQLGVAPEHVLFLDDFEAMVDGARSVGMQAVHVTDTETAIGDARALLDL